MPEYFRDHLRKQDVMVLRHTPVARSYRFVSPMPATSDYETARVTGVTLGTRTGLNQCLECGWYSAVSRQPDRITHFQQCSMYNPQGVEE